MKTIDKSDSISLTGKEEGVRIGVLKAVEEIYFFCHDLRLQYSKKRIAELSNKLKATGYIDFSGDMDFCITIRTMIKKGSRVYLQAGAGIVADSVPEKEYQECCNKVMALAKTLVEEENL